MCVLEAGFVSFFFFLSVLHVTGGVANLHLCCSSFQNGAVYLDAGRSITPSFTAIVG